jgi:alpha-L-arabinofuranosidase
MRRGKCSEWGSKGSAWLHEKDLALTVVNLHVSQDHETEIGVRGAALKPGSATTHAHSDIHAPNTFAHRDVVIPQTKVFEVKGRTLHCVFPSASVTKLLLTLS